MKTLLHFFYCFFLILILISCSKDEISEDSNELTSYTDAALSQNSVQLSYDSISSSTNKTGYPVTNVSDGSTSTRWAGFGTAASIYIDLGTEKAVDYVNIAFPGGNSRIYSFSYWVSTDGNSWTWVNTKKSTELITALQTIDLSNQTSRYIRFKFQGSNVNNWNYVSELQVYGTEIDSPSTTVTASGVDFDNLIVETSWTTNDSDDRDEFNASDVDGESWMDVYSSGETMLKCLAADGHRTELKENSGDEASLSIYKRMLFTARVHSIPENGVTVAQVHNRGGVNRPLLRLYIDSDRYFKVKITDTTPDESSSEYTILDGPKYSSGDYFDVSITTENGNAIVSITTNGITETFTIRPSNEWSDFSNDYYLKAGVYTEGNSTQPQIKFSNFSIQH